MELVKFRRIIREEIRSVIREELSLLKEEISKEKQIITRNPTKTQGTLVTNTSIAKQLKKTDEISIYGEALKMTRESMEPGEYSEFLTAKTTPGQVETPVLENREVAVGVDMTGAPDFLKNATAIFKKSVELDKGIHGN